MPRLSPCCSSFIFNPESMDNCFFKLIVGDHTKLQLSSVIYGTNSSIVKTLDESKIPLTLMVRSVFIFSSVWC